MDTKTSYNNYSGRVRSFIKIQEGCSTKCSYCIVPEVRGCERSIPSRQILEEIETKSTLSYKEVVLTGTNIDSYEAEGIGLYDLVKMILNNTGIPRIHLSSLQVNIITSQFLALWRDERLCRHFHMSLQSGSDTVLMKMKRKYSLEKYERAVTMIKDTIPEAAVTTDIIVGFPGETDSEFDQSYSFCQQMKFAAIHVFPYSKRSGTEAADFPDQISDKIKRTRVHRMLSLANTSRENFHTLMLNKYFSVLWEHQRKDKDRLFTGLTDNYVRIYAQNKNQIENSISTVRLTSLYKEGIFGEFIHENTG
jgi:threonylcarbamoyladenosine tRNA methylthiotransferase MtaB